MTLHIETPQRGRLATCNKNSCPQCSGWLLAPDWSEHLSERCVRHAWSCEACGYEFVLFRGGRGLIWNAGTCVPKIAPP